MTSYLVDTSIIIDFLRGKEGAVDFINSLQGDITSSYVCLAELYEGVHRSAKKEKQEVAIVDLFASLGSIFPVDEPVAKTFGELRATLKMAGTIIEDMDLLIAATCLVYYLVLVTRNQKHFSRVEGLEILTPQN